jgi:hypothetical protein
MNGGERMRLPQEEEFTINDVDRCEVPFCAQTNDVAPLFSAEAYHSITDSINKVNLVDYRGKWTVLLFYSSDFTFV